MKEGASSNCLKVAGCDRFEPRLEVLKPLYNGAPVMALLPTAAVLGTVDGFKTYADCHNNHKDGLQPGS